MEKKMLDFFGKVRYLFYISNTIINNILKRKQNGRLQKHNTRQYC